MNSLFHLTEQDTTISREIRAGLTTFLAMAYIIFVNPTFLSAAGMDADAAMIATCLSAALGSMLSAFVSNQPFAMASGMGMNAFFTYTLCFGYDYTWQQALALTFLSGILFFLAVLVLRDKVMYLIPANLKHAITVGIGLLLVFIGALDGGLIEMTAGFPALGNIFQPNVMIAIIGIALIMTLPIRNIPGALLIGMLITALLSLLFGQTALPDQAIILPTAISKSILKLDFHGLIAGHNLISFLALLLSMTIVDMFDTLGFLVGTGSRADLLDEEGNLSNMHRVMLADAGSTVIGSLFGTSTVTVYAESASGIAAGGRTGLTACTTAICFLLSTFFAPLTNLVNSSVTAPALIIVGMYLVMDIRKMDLSSMEEALPSLLTLIMIPLSYSITTGIATGFLSFVICKIAAGKAKELKPSVLLLAAVFLLYFCI